MLTRGLLNPGRAVVPEGGRVQGGRRLERLRGRRGGVRVSNAVCEGGMKCSRFNTELVEGVNLVSVGREVDGFSGCH